MDCPMLRKPDDQIAADLADLFTQRPGESDQSFGIRMLCEVLAAAVGAALAFAGIALRWSPAETEYRIARRVTAGTRWLKRHPDVAHGIVVGVVLVAGISAATDRYEDAGVHFAAIATWRMVRDHPERAEAALLARVTVERAGRLGWLFGGLLRALSGSYARPAQSRG